MVQNKIQELRKQYGDSLIEFYTMGNSHLECRDLDAHTVSKLCGAEHGVYVEREMGTDYCLVGTSVFANVVATLKGKGQKVLHNGRIL
jgi:hypothetical protein